MYKCILFFWAFFVSCSTSSKIESRRVENISSGKLKLPIYIELDAVFYKDSIKNLLFKNLKSRNINIITQSELSNLTERSMTDKIKRIKSDNSIDYTQALSNQNEAVAVYSKIAIAFENQNSSPTIKEITWKSFGFPPNLKNNYEEKRILINRSNTFTLNGWINILTDSLINERIPGIK
ncbi:MAG: hypothetical protein SFU21_16300 [Flavihumibacter sp.]|nr:hypothetical protein [Flavihumibacter sp.]